MWPANKYTNIDIEKCHWFAWQSKYANYVVWKVPIQKCADWHVICSNNIHPNIDETRNENEVPFRQKSFYISNVGEMILLTTMS